MENTELMKSAEDAFHERFGRPLKNGSEVKFTAGGDTMLVSEKEILDFIHSYTASREKKAYLEGRESRQSEVDFLRKEAYGDLPLP